MTIKYSCIEIVRMNKSCQGLPREMLLGVVNAHLFLVMASFYCKYAVGMVVYIKTSRINSEVHINNNQHISILGSDE